MTTNLNYYKDVISQSGPILEGEAQSLLIYFGAITSLPPMYGLKTSGITTLPSACW